MNVKFILVQAVIAVCVTEGFSLTCPTCRGTECSQKVNQLECNRHSLPLPVEFGSENTFVSDKEEYGCLSLEYKTGNDVTQLRQCIRVETDGDVCNELTKNLIVKKCSVSNSSLEKLMEGGEGGGDDDKSSSKNTDPPTDPATGPTTEDSPTTTESSSVTKTSSILTIFVVILFNIHM